MTFNSVGVVGGGAWGTALAQTVCRAGRNTLIWAREADVVAEIAARWTNTPFLPGVALDPALRATADIAEVAQCDVVLMVAPAQHVRGTGAALAPSLAPGKPVVICAKGLEQATGKLLADVLGETLPQAQATLAVLSGPSFAADVVRGLPTALTLASADDALGVSLAETLSSRPFRIYRSTDPIGVQLGGAIKNVLAIAAGIVEGKQLGASAHAALVARGFAEMRRLGEALGARSETLMGLSGLGDLLLTCGSPQSRNMSLGRALGQGQELGAILASRRSVAEGVYTAAAVVKIANERGIDMPISQAVHAIVEGRQSVDAAIESLLSRPLRTEG
ncbi:MAG TPA: NAD(P)H-dependent glycerol-3-phosphate dehydrogenase [Hyphomicrobiaceae bacterium]|nr:NAD(P)H-dependent glycerol-3-phosphate dehydrogenase [Hyphomicrobiaceae bacterium]